MSEGQWSKLVQIHNYTKKLVLLSEEMDPEHELALAPLIQQRDTLEHIMRTKACELGLTQPEEPGKYKSGNLDKALGHTYRAFFDAADIVAILYREKLKTATAPYTTACIAAVIPNYYDEILTRTEEISRGIAKVRGAKDIANHDGLLAEVETYMSYIEELKEFYKTVLNASAALQDWNKKDRRTIIRNTIIALVAAIVVAVVSFALGRIGQAKPVDANVDPQTSRTQPAAKTPTTP